MSESRSSSSVERYTIFSCSFNGKVQNVHTKKWKKHEVSTSIDYMGQAKIYETELGGKSYAIKTYKNDNYQNIWCQSYSRQSQRMCEYLDMAINKSGKYGDISQIVVAKKNTLQGIAAYDYNKNILFICEELVDDANFEKIVDTKFFAARSLEDILNHELGGHKKHWEAVARYYATNSYASMKIAKQELEATLREYIVSQMRVNPFYIRDIISNNAYEQFMNKKILNECIADAIILSEKDMLQDNILVKLIEEVINYDGYAK